MIRQLFARRSVSERVCGNGHGPGTDYGRSLVTAALMLLASAAWIRAVAPAHDLRFRVAAGGALLLGYLGVRRLVRRRLNWLELVPRTDRVPKSEIDGFVTLTSALIAAAGLSLIGANPPIVGLLIGCNLVCGLMIVDASRRLRRKEVSTDGATHNVVNLGVYAALRGLLLWQIRFLVMALAAALLMRL